MIESFMLIVNETVAEHFLHDWSCRSYRLGKIQKQKKYRSLSIMLSSFGIQIYNG